MRCMETCGKGSQECYCPNTPTTTNYCETQCPDSYSNCYCLEVDNNNLNCNKENPGEVKIYPDCDYWARYFALHTFIYLYYTIDTNLLTIQLGNPKIDYFAAGWKNNLNPNSPFIYGIRVNQQLQIIEWDIPYNLTDANITCGFISIYAECNVSIAIEDFFHNHSISYLGYQSAEIATYTNDSTDIFYEHSMNMNILYMLCKHRLHR